MESFVTSVETFSQKKIKTPPSWKRAKSENKKNGKDRSSGLKVIGI
jgi:hypothetical protein